MDSRELTMKDKALRSVKKGFDYLFRIDLSDKLAYVLETGRPWRCVGVGTFYRKELESKKVYIGGKEYVTPKRYRVSFRPANSLRKGANGD